MNKTIIGVILSVTLAITMTSFSVLAEPKGEKISVKGEVVDLWCFLEGGDHGAEHKACSTSCAKAGNPIGLLSEKQDVYVLMGIQDHQPAKDVLIAKMNETVTIEGTLVKKGGTQEIGRAHV